MKFRVGEKIFDSSGEAYEYCIENDISVEDIEEFEEEESVIDESEESEEDLVEEPEDFLDEADKEDRDELLDLSLRTQNEGITQATEGLMEEYQIRFSKIADDTSFVCPICSRDLKADAVLKGEKLSKKASVEKLRHLKSEHPLMWNMLKDLFKVPHSERKYDDIEAYDQESHLSKEELAEKIASDSGLRRELFKLWLEKKKEDRD